MPSFPNQLIETKCSPAAWTAFTYGNVEYEPHRRAQFTIVIFSFEGRAGSSDDLKNVPIPVSETSRQKSISE